MSYPLRPSWRSGERRDPFAVLEAVQERINRLVGDTLAGYRGRTPLWHPDIDMDVTPDGWIVEVRLPGVAPDEVEVEIDDRELCIRSRHGDTDLDEEPVAETAPVARRWGDFQYRLSLPTGVDPAGIDATMDHGLLVVRLPRSTAKSPRKIEIGRSAPVAESAPESTPTWDPAAADEPPSTWEPEDIPEPPAWTGPDTPVDPVPDAEPERDTMPAAAEPAAAAEGATTGMDGPERHPGTDRPAG